MKRGLFPRTVFSLADYQAEIGGFIFTAKDIKGIKLIRSAENPPVKGIVKSELVISVKTGEMFSPNAPVRVSSEGLGIRVGTHFISSISRKGDIVTIRAYDRMRMTENEFDGSDYSDGDRAYDVSQVVQAIAAQCGFTHGDSGFSGVQHIYAEHIKGKKCREILQLLSEVGVGVWYCSDDEELRFTPFLSASTAAGVDMEKSSRLYIHSRKGPFRGAAAKNTALSEWYRAGSVSDFRGVLKLKGRLLDQGRVREIMTGIAGKYWDSFYCAHAAISFLPCGLTEFIFGDRLGLISVKTTVTFGAAGMYACAETADICEDESDYTDAVGYELRKKLEEGRLYGDTVLTDRGLGITAGKEGLSSRQISFFSSVADGIASFGGAVLDGVMPDSIVSLADNIKLIRYGENVFRLSFEVGADGEKTNIRLERSDEQ